MQNHRNKIGSSSTLPKDFFGSSKISLPLGISFSLPSTLKFVSPIDSYPKVGQTIIDPNTYDTYLLKMEIGSSCRNGLCRVYKALYTKRMEKNGIFVTLKILNKNLREFFELQLEVNASIRFTPYSKLIGLMRTFTTKEYLCVSFPYMSQGPLRHILSARPEKKLPEDFIAIVLKEVLVGLRDELHVDSNNPKVHKTLNAGDIFIHIDHATKERLIKLAFEASVYDPFYNVGETSSSSSTFLDVKSISKWGAAPEVYVGENATPKSDIWLLGITALELAYGDDLRVRSREDLEYIIEKIRFKKRLPRSLEKLLIIKKKGKIKKVVLNTFKRNKRVFSKDFEKMVLACLCENPEERPTAHQLSSTPFFTTDFDRFEQFLLNG
ncbi:serine/threonine-protein kinase BLUS1-like [Lycium ferocissimum]|uniref:serine/threonine-protein kinase BLUS1-like n=1 Tax=Lycium ferocissimum TaxID=112874 RepID=UPI0028169C1E|nr:serine/threonine-protein kinase BLUS1-like [Lycium ferocissimum]